MVGEFGVLKSLSTSTFDDLTSLVYEESENNLNVPFTSLLEVKSLGAQNWTIA